jgi:hypothetical protein
MGPGAGKRSGGGGGFGDVGGGGAVGGPASGNPQISTHAGNRGSGGGGGDGGALNSGGTGGAGGGSIEISALGTTTVGNVEAKGGNGANGATNGGGGSGGLILLRGKTVTAGTLNVTGGNGTNMGGPGRIRIDAATAGAIPSSTPGGFRGPMWDFATPLLTRDIQPTLKAFGESGSNFTYRIFDETKQTAKGPFNGSIANGSNNIQLLGELFRGINTICITVEGGNDTNAEATNCIDLVYVTTL